VVLVYHVPHENTWVLVVLVSSYFAYLFKSHHSTHLTRGSNGIWCSLPEIVRTMVILSEHVG
jgi:hypothetical protein